MKDTPDIEMSLATDQICYIVIKGREFEAKEMPSGLTYGSNASDDAMASVLEMRRNDPVFDELHLFISDLNEDQQIDLVALARVGRGDFTLNDWAEARQAAADARSGPTISRMRCRTWTAVVKARKWGGFNRRPGRK